MKLAIGNDHSAVEMKKEIKKYLEDKGIEVIDVGTNSTESFNYPISGYKVGKMVANGEVDGGVLICGTGVGISLAANKVKGVRACVCSEPYSARMSKQHNNSNIIAFGARVIGVETAKMIVDEWLNAKYEGGRHQVRVDMLTEIEQTQGLKVVDEQGPRGARAARAPLAHMSLPLLGLGEVEYKGEVRPSAEVLAELGLEPIRLQSKEGLALLNGTQFMSAYGVWSLIHARRLSEWADRIGALSLDAFDGRIEPFCDEVHLIRAHRGQLATARNVRGLLEGSELIARPKHHVQDPYSFRCMPQVHGASKDTIDYVESVLTTEINSTTDNPTVFPEEDMVVSAGNFHGQPIALAMDFLAIALAELGNISERRTYKLISGARELPKFLVANPGLNSGFMIPQYTAASIVSQSKGLCMPASVDSIPSSQGQEDHVSMGSNAATKLWRVVCNTERVLAIELFNAAQAIEFRRPAHTSPELERMLADYRKEVPFIDNDEVMYPHIEASVRFLRGL